MSFELFCHIIDQLAGRNLLPLCLHQSGEPLLHPRIIEMIGYVKRKKAARVRFATNATVLNEELADGLIESGLDCLIVSMDSSTASEYCPARVKRDLILDLDEKILGLINLRNRRGLKNPKIYLQIIDMPRTQGLIESFAQKWKGLADGVIIKRLLSWAGYNKLPQKLPPRRLVCNNLLGQGVVQWDGEAAFCCLYLDRKGDSSGILGNAACTSLEDIFLGQRRREIIEAQLRGDYDLFPYCQNCPDWVDILDSIWAKKVSSPEMG